MAIKVHLDEVLRARGMTAKELCAQVGITEANLSILRSGKAKGVRFGTINRICYYLPDFNGCHGFYLDRVQPGPHRSARPGDRDGTAHRGVSHYGISGSL